MSSGLFHERQKPSDKKPGDYSYQAQKTAVAATASITSADINATIAPATAKAGNKRIEAAVSRHFITPS